MPELADAHLHVFNAEELAAYEDCRAEFGIATGLVVGYEGTPDHAGNNAALREWAAARPWMAPLAFAPVGSPPTADVLDWAVGLSIYAAAPTDAAALDAWPTTTRRALADKAAVVSVNTTPDALPALRTFLASLEGATVLISHLGLPRRRGTPPSRRDAAEEMRPLTALADLPHVGVKASGLYAVVDPPNAFPAAAYPSIEATVERFGIERLYWGSDFAPVLQYLTFADAVAALDGLGLSADERSLVYRKNLQQALARVDRPRATP